MTSQQKIILLVLILVNGVCFCCGLPAAILLLSDSLDPTTAFVFAPTETPTRPAPTATFTLTPSPTTQATATRVIPLVTPRPTSSVTPTRKSPNAAITPTKTSAPNPAASTGNPYNIVLPLPTIPALTYAIDFQDSIRVVTYTVTGTSYAEINASLAKNPIAHPHRQTFGVGLTELTFQYRVSTLNKGSAGCQLDHGTVTAAMTITLPALKSTSGVPADVLNRWNQFARDVSIHEQKHARLNLEGARTFQTHLGNIGSAANCNTLDAEVQKVYQQSFDWIERVNTDLDAKEGIIEFP